MSGFCNKRCGRRGLLVLLVWLACPAALPAQQPPPTRIPLPDPETQNQRLRLFRDVFGQEYDDADTPEKKLALADKLLQSASQTQNDDAGRYVLCKTARELAAAAGDARKALEAADAIAAAFDVDGLPMKAATLAQTAPAARSPAQCAALATVAYLLVDEAVIEDRCELAGQLADLALAAARSSRDAVFIRRVVAWGKRLEAAREAYEEVAPAFTTLKSDATDPEANLAVGRFLAFRKGQWDKAISYLALGREAELKGQAQAELKAPTSPDDQVNLADGWWRLGEAAEGDARAQLQGHAAQWYRKALPQLTGLSQAKVEARLDAVGTSHALAGRIALGGDLEQPIPGEISELQAAFGTDKTAVDVTEIVRKLYGRDPFAPIHAAGAKFGDPAPGKTKHLYLQYRFGRQPIRRTVRGGDFETIPAVPDQGVQLREATEVFTVLAARYGGLDTWMDVTPAVALLVSDPAEPFRFGVAEAGQDPLFGVNKVLVVWFDYRGVRYVRTMPTERPGTLLPDLMPPKPMGRRKHKRSKRRRRRNPRGAGATPVGLRIVGGRLRGRKLDYRGDPNLRPMKDRVREAVFNLLGPAIQGKHAIDLFAGTGALALEAISRGAAQATLIEQRVPTAEIIRRNIAALGVESLCRLVTADLFIWWKRQTDLGPGAWLVFCSPPYDFYVDRAEEMLELLEGLVASAPAESLFVVECDARFDLGRLPDPDSWAARSYPPAVVAIYRKPGPG